MAAPPTINARRLDTSRGLDFSSWYNPFQIVGTPAATVTFIFQGSLQGRRSQVHGGHYHFRPTIVHA